MTRYYNHCEQTANAIRDRFLAAGYTVRQWIDDSRLAGRFVVEVCRSASKVA